MVAVCIVGFRTVPSRGLQFQKMKLQNSAVDDKVEVKEYFNNEGFNRWNKIYSDSDEVNKVQLDIRNGHQQTIDKVLNWVANEKNGAKTICDAGCGVGSLALPLATQFKKVFASDISESMTKEAAKRAAENKINNVVFEVKDMEALSGKYDTVTCIDVMIHYPTDKVSSGSFFQYFVLN
jgi:magnesium-protoporphyrin O-methyltransferase